MFADIMSLSLNLHNDIPLPRPCNIYCAFLFFRLYMYICNKTFSCHTSPGINAEKSQYFLLVYFFFFANIAQLSRIMICLGVGKTCGPQSRN